MQSEAEWAQPDIEAHLTQLLKLAGIAGVKLWIGDLSSKWPHWSVTYLIRVESYGASKAAANETAYDAQAVMLGAEVSTWQDGVVLGVDIADAPAWTPKPNGAPVYAAAYRVIVRPKGTQP